MATHEREITDPVDLCTSSGGLDRAAAGWSRVPLHRANLSGSWGRSKRWDYWAVLAGDLVVSATYADVDYVGLADVWWTDLSTGRTGGRGTVRPLAVGMSLPEVPGTAPLRVASGALQMDITDGPLPHGGVGTRVRAHWVEPTGEMARLDVEIELPDGHESLNVVVPWSERTFQFTSKHQARPAVGELVIGDEHRGIGRDGDAWGVLDVGRGRWPYSTRWNWGGGAGRVGRAGPVVGLQLGGMWTVGTGATENGVIVDGRLTKVGDELQWDYDWGDPMRPWVVRSPDRSIDVRLTPRHDKHTSVDALVLRTETHQVFGTWSGSVTPDDGEPIVFEALQGFAEESRSRW